MSETKDLTYLLDINKYAGDSDFVMACYKDLLGRVPGINELFDADCLLSEGMPRKVYLASIALSPECQGHCDSNGMQLEGLGGLKSALKKYNLRHRLDKVLLSNEVTGKSSKAVDVRFGYPCKDEYPSAEVSFFDAEFSALNNCQMDSLRQYIEENFCCGDEVSSDSDGVFTNAHIGEFAGEFLPTSKEMYEVLSDVDEDETLENLLITSPSDVDFTLSEEELERTAKTISNALLFTMPALPGSDAPVSVVFDKHWRGFDSTARFCERYSTGGETAAIFLMNNTDDTVRATISFKVISFTNAELVISQAQNSFEVSLDKPSIEVNLDLILLPGYNPVTFSYVGVPYKSEVTGGEPVRFAVRDLTICLHNVASSYYTFDTSGSWTLSGADAYKLDTMTHGDGYYKHLMSDRAVRFKLHEHGFFEVKAVRFYDDYSVVEEDTTRYLEFRYGDLDTNFQVHKKAPDAGKGASRASVRLYIAKRNGAI